tara:strand:- start:490 stop:654 length:165 start_codon:yes stop_codon:yes gene_type:complete
MKTTEEQILKVEKLMRNLEALDAWDAYDHQIYDYHKHELKRLTFKREVYKDENI